MPTTEVANIIAIARRATPAEIESGVQWYQTAHNEASRIATLNEGAGVIAALSPRMPWDRNLAIAERAFVEGRASGALSANVAKANAILDGADPLDVLGGLKVRSFYANIIYPDGRDGTIDRLGFDMVNGRSTSDRERSGLSRKGVYEMHADYYREAGVILGLTGAQVQAITWCTWRRIKGIK